MMTLKDAIALRSRLNWECSCACGFLRLCDSKEDAERTASRHAFFGHNPSVGEYEES